MGLLKWLFGDSRIAESDKLIYIEKYSTYDSYGDKFEHHSPIPSVNDFWDNVRQDVNRRIAISCTLYGRTIPLIDADSDTNLEKVTGRLSSLGVGSAIFESSPGHFWVFPDISFKSFTAAWKAMLNVPGNDLKYLKFTERQKLFQVRGELKNWNDPKPKLIHYDVREKNVKEFVYKLTEHYSAGVIDAIAELRKPKPKKKAVAVPNPWAY